MTRIAKLSICLGLILSANLITSCTPEEPNTEYLLAFAKVYGYVKYFHPSDESTEIDWKKFSIYGAEQILDCQSDEELIETLDVLFHPIAPTVRFYTNDTMPPKTYHIPMDSETYQETYWQHRGVSEGMVNRSKIYNSHRINKDPKSERDSLFVGEPKKNEVFIKEISDGIFCDIPLRLYFDDIGTFPKGVADDFDALENNLDEVDTEDVNKRELRLGNIINTFNVFQHFYPYFDVVEVDWEKEFLTAINRSLIDKTQNDHLVTLKKFTATLCDGHVGVYHSSQGRFVPPIQWEWIEEKLVITGLAFDETKIKIGDVVTHVNGQVAEAYFNEINSMISYGTEGWLHYRSCNASLYGADQSILTLRIDGKDIEVKRMFKDQRDFAKKESHKELQGDIWYLNIGLVNMDTITKLLPELQKSKAIICDLRGYPNSNHEFIRHLMKDDDTAQDWMRIPYTVYPDGEKSAGYYSSDWIEFMTAKEPYLGDKNIIFIIDGRAISYAESFMGFIEGYDLATIIGQPTAGTNGNVNSFYLPGGYSISWTGMKVLKHDGSQHHSIGIQPDIYLNRTIAGVKENRDEFLEKAMELAIE